MNDAEHRAADATAPTTLANTAALFSNPASGVFDDVGCRTRFTNGTPDVELLMSLLDRAAYLVASRRSTTAAFAFVHDCALINAAQCRTPSFPLIIDAIASGPRPERLPVQSPCGLPQFTTELAT